ncbi:MAG: FAD-dependent oxidoreductase [bacterium]
MFDLIIIGGGPAGVAAGVYAARKKLKTLLLTDSIGGQSVVSATIENWIGSKSIAGADLAKSLANHILSYESETVVIKKGVKVAKADKQSDHFIITDSQGDTYEGKTVLVATGADRRKLTVPGSAEFEQKGITYCASCDGPLFSDHDVVVIGGGNAGFESASQLLAYCESVTVLEYLPDFKAEKITVEKLKQNPKFKACTNVELLEVRGDKFVNSVVYKNRTTGEVTTLPTTGVFVEIGFVASSPFISHLVKTNPFGAIEIDPWTGKTSQEGIWAAGDCTNIIYHQNNIAVGEAIKATEDIYNYLSKK